MAELFENATEDGDYSIVQVRGLSICMLQIVGTWGGATVTLKAKPEESSQFSAAPDSMSVFTEDTLIGVILMNGSVQATISGAGPTTNLSAYLQPG